MINFFSKINPLLLCLRFIFRTIFRIKNQPVWLHLQQRFNTFCQNHGLARRHLYLGAAIIDLVLIGLIVANGMTSAERLTATLVSPITPLRPLTKQQIEKRQYEVFGFAPHWTMKKLDNVDFDTLTTLAYFGVDLEGDGNINRSDEGYAAFKSREATNLFKKAHIHGTRVVLTVTQMKNQPILDLLDSPEAQQLAITQIVDEVQARGIDGINVDLEYTGNPGSAYRVKFTKFVADLTNEMHRQNPNSKVTVSVYASAVKEPKVYDIAGLSKVTDGIFMMAYDFAVAGSDNAIPTAPLYGYKEGAYWYDISTAVDDFLKFMPAEKLILGVPYYGYNYLVYSPSVKAETRPRSSWKGKPAAQTYTIAQTYVQPDVLGKTEYLSGWDEHGQVGWRAYYVPETDTWRMLFLDDEKSLGIKYDYAKAQNLAGIGMWALGFDNGKTELWSLIREKFGVKVADASVIKKARAYEENN